MSESIEERKIRLKEEELALKHRELDIREMEAAMGGDRPSEPRESQSRKKDGFGVGDFLLGGAVGLGLGGLFDDD